MKKNDKKVSLIIFTAAEICTLIEDVSFLKLKIKALKVMKKLTEGRKI